MARSVIPVLTPSHNSAVAVDLMGGGIELNALAAHGGPLGDGYSLFNPAGRTELYLLLDAVSRSKGKLTIPTQLTAGDTFTIDAKTFTVRALVDFDVNGEVLLGATVAESRANIVAAIMGTDGVNTIHPTVRAQAFNGSNYTVLTAVVPGAAGDSIVTTETFAAVGNVFDGATLGTLSAGGQDSSATVSVIAVPDPYGRGGPLNTPTYNLTQTLTALAGGNRILNLGSYGPVVYNQSGDLVNVDVTALVGSGKLVGVNA